MRATDAPALLALAAALVILPLTPACGGGRPWALESVRPELRRPVKLVRGHELVWVTPGDRLTVVARDASGSRFGRYLVGFDRDHQALLVADEDHGAHAVALDQLAALRVGEDPNAPSYGLRGAGAGLVIGTMAPVIWILNQGPGATDPGLLLAGSAVLFGLPTALLGGLIGASLEPDESTGPLYPLTGEDAWRIGVGPPSDGGRR